MTNSAERSVLDWLSLVRGARRRHEYLEAIDLSQAGLQQHPASMLLHYEKILAYARSGATKSAAASLAALTDNGDLDTITERDLRCDFDGLAARLLKDRALATDAVDPALARQAAEAYGAAFDRHLRSYLAINAATLFCLAVDETRAGAFARAALAHAADEPSPYFRFATVAEACVVLGDITGARAALEQALAASPAPDEVATTRRQLLRLCAQRDSGAAILGVLPTPYILCWRADPAAADELGFLPELRRVIEQRIGNGADLIAYGAIRGLADIAVAELLIEAGADTNLVIAATHDECAHAIAARSGPRWAARFAAVTSAARRVMEVTLEGDTSEPTVAWMAGQQALGLAAMRAAAAVAPLHHANWGADGIVTVAEAPILENDPIDPASRMPRAFVFGDVKGFSQLREAEHRPFLDYVIGGFADALATLGDVVEYVEVAGDGIFVVLSNVIAALRCCDRLRRIFVPELLRQAQLPPTLGLRVGAHFGPAARGLDRVTGRQKFIGKEVIRAARLEPVTPVGEIYVTEQFAATLFATTRVGHACEYVGERPMAKGFGTCRMYSLRPTREILRLLDASECRIAFGKK